MRSDDALRPPPRPRSRAGQRTGPRAAWLLLAVGLVGCVGGEPSPSPGGGEPPSADAGAAPGPSSGPVPMPGERPRADAATDGPGGNGPPPALPPPAEPPADAGAGLEIDARRLPPTTSPTADAAAPRDARPGPDAPPREDARPGADAAPPPDARPGADAAPPPPPAPPPAGPPPPASGAGTCSLVREGGTGPEAGGQIPVCCAPSAPEKAVVDEVFALVNAHRQANGLAPLVYDPKLEAAIQGHCVHMATHGFFDHAAPEAAVASFTSRARLCGAAAGGENIARGQRTAAEVMKSWKESPGHDANMLNPRWKRMGVGMHKLCWGQIFAP